MAVVQAKQDALAARIAGLSFDAAGWQGALRTEALARLTAMGLPAKRDEYWRYTNPATLVAPQPVVATATTEEPALFTDLDCLKLVFVDGQFDAAQSDPLALEGVSLAVLSQAKADIHWAADLFGQLEARGQSPVQRPLATLNTAFAGEGVLIHVTGKPSKPVSLIYRATSAGCDAILHHCVKMEAGSELTLLEQGTAGARVNLVTEVDIADGALFHHIRAQGRVENDSTLTHIFARIGQEAVMELLGNDSSAHVAGAALGEGGVHQDDTVFITHAAERCESRQVFKKVLKNGAVGVFQGKILVKQGAQKTDGYQISQALLLDGDSQFLAKPELEIYADDVKCSHGSTSGAIDETALFYLRSRGVPLRAAQSLLVLAFLAEAIGEIEDEAIAEAISARLQVWLDWHEQ